MSVASDNEVVIELRRRSDDGRDSVSPASSSAVKPIDPDKPAVPLAKPRGDDKADPVKKKRGKDDAIDPFARKSKPEQNE